MFPSILRPEIAECHPIFNEVLLHLGQVFILQEHHEFMRNRIKCTLVLDEPQLVDKSEDCVSVGCVAITPSRYATAMAFHFASNALHEMEGTLDPVAVELVQSRYAACGFANHEGDVINLYITCIYDGSDEFFPFGGILPSRADAVGHWKAHAVWIPHQKSQCHITFSIQAMHSVSEHHRMAIFHHLSLLWAANGDLDIFISLKVQKVFSVLIVQSLTSIEVIPGGLSLVVCFFDSNCHRLIQEMLLLSREIMPGGACLILENIDSLCRFES